MESLHQRVETWIKGQRAKVTWPPQWKMVVRWPWSAGREERKRIQEELERKKKQLQNLCSALKTESLTDLQDILCCMVLSECVYKRPESEMVRAVNKFKADFGGHVVALERVQPSADHVPHRYLLAEAGDTLFASFIGTKQYKDIMADVNIFQGAIFHEDTPEDLHGIEPTESLQFDTQKNNIESIPKSLESKRPSSKPAVHRGFMARAKGIPALELYKLAQRKKRKLVLCGHSLGGAVAVLATLAILRVIATSSKESEKVQVKCITFSQPPVGNASLRDYVNRKGWQHYFKTYCIPEDIVPRILSPAYFHHYNSQLSPPTLKHEAKKAKENETEQLVLGLGPVQNPLWRLSKLVPLEGFKRHFNRYTVNNKLDPVKVNTSFANNNNSVTSSSIKDIATVQQSLEIEENSDGISLRPLPEIDEEPKNGNNSNKGSWRKLPALPSYVPFGQLYILENSSVESLSGAEYSKLTSVRSLITEVRERFQSHSMRSYRSRFQRIYDQCMNENESSSSYMGMEQVKQFPYLQKWLGISVAGTVELGNIVEAPHICAATSIVPLEWGEKNGDLLKVDISGFGLHLCTIIQAKVGGNWCSTTVETFPSPPNYTQEHVLQPEIQKMRIIVGAPLKRPPKQHIIEEKLVPMFQSIDSAIADLQLKQKLSTVNDGKYIRPDGLGDFVIYCTTDFSTISKEVHLRTRRVRLIGLEGSGKSSLLKAILEQGKNGRNSCPEDIIVEEGISGGLCYSDSAGVNLQNLVTEASNFRDELWKGIRDLSKKTDLIVLVHNLSHRIPKYVQNNATQPALSLFLEEAKCLGIPWVLAISNKFSVSAHEQKAAINAVLQAYQALPKTTEIINSCPYVMPSWGTSEDPTKLILNIMRKPFQKKGAVLPVDGVTGLCQIVHSALKKHEDAAFEELARDRLYVELARERALAEGVNREDSYNAAAVGASLGAGLGVVLAVVMGAASALRKPP